MSAKRVTRGRFAFIVQITSQADGWTVRCARNVGPRMVVQTPVPLARELLKSAPVTPPSSRRGTSRDRQFARSSGSRPARPLGRKKKFPQTSCRSDYVTEEVVARAKALKRLHDLLGGAYGRRRVPMDTGVPTYSVAPLIAGGCLRFVLLLLLFLLLSFLGLSIVGNLFILGF